MNDHKKDYKDLPRTAVDFIESVIKKVRYRKKVRQEVRDELIDHFAMALSECNTAEEKEAAAHEMIEEFGDIKTLACLIRRGKKRCRPLWKKIIIRTFQGIGISILCFILYAVWFFNGDANPTIDYLEIFNEHVRPEIVDADNAWPHYEKALILYVDPNGKIGELSDQLLKNPRLQLSSLSDEERVLIETWIGANEAAWVEYAAGAKMAYCYREYGYGESEAENKWLLYVMVPHIPELKRLSQIGVWRSKLALEEGNSQSALENCVTLLKVSKQWQNRVTLIESLVGMAIGDYGNMQALQIAAEGGLTLEEFGVAQGELSAVFARGYPRVDFEGERLLMRDMIQNCFTDGGPGGGHLVTSKAFFELSDTDEQFYLMSGTLIHAGRDKTAEITDDLYDKLTEMSVMSPYEKHVRSISMDEILKELPEYRYFIIHMMVPALDKVCHIRFEKEATYKAMLTVFAIKRWQLEKGKLPEDLNVLVDAGLLDGLPDDPYSDGSLVYRPDGKDFTLYSVGRNFTDDGGIAGTDKKDKYRLWGENGDAVFWPVR